MIWINWLMLLVIKKSKFKGYWNRIINWIPIIIIKIIRVIIQIIKFNKRIKD